MRGFEFDESINERLNDMIADCKSPQEFELRRDEFNFYKKMFEYGEMYLIEEDINIEPLIAAKIVDTCGGARELPNGSEFYPYEILELHGFKYGIMREPYGDYLGVVSSKEGFEQLNKDCQEMSKIRSEFADFALTAPLTRSILDSTDDKTIDEIEFYSRMFDRYDILVGYSGMDLYNYIVYNSELIWGSDHKCKNGDPEYSIRYADDLIVGLEFHEEFGTTAVWFHDLEFLFILYYKMRLE